MRVRSRSRVTRFERISLELTPLVDIVFLLLIFLVTTTTFVAEERVIDVKLPHAFTGAAGSNRSEGIDVIVDRNGNIFVNGEPTHLQDLAGVVQVKVLTDGVKKARILADEVASYGLVIKVMDVLRAVGVTDVELSVESGGG